MPLFGREPELKVLSELIDEPGSRSGALLVGEAGIGKSALLAEAVALASVAGVRVLKATGVEAEQDFAYAGLHQLLYPVRAGVDELPPAQRDALRCALGLAEAAEPSPYLVGLATLTLLAELAPLLVVAEDVHWLDQASVDVLAFVARRIEAEPMVLLAATREGGPLQDAGLHVMPLERLSGESAAELLDSTAFGLEPEARERLLAEAAGNPLALTELPGALDRLDPVLPLTDRLRRAFAARVSGLPEETRTALLIAALNQSDSAAEVLAATGRVLGAADLDLFTPAVNARLIDLGPGTVTFRHPLMRSAIPAASSLTDQRRAHLALAETDQPDRSAWHRAAATAGLDEDVAEELTGVAERALERGGVAAAITTLERAAQLSERQGTKADRLLRAAELAAESGRRDTADRLVREARTLDLSPPQRATASWLPSIFDDGVREDSSRIGELAELAGSVTDPDAASRILWGAAMRCFWAEPGEAARRTLLTVLDRLPLADDDPRKVAIAAYVAPFDRAGVVLSGLRAAAVADPETQRFLGSAALQIGAFDLAARFSAAAAPGLRAQGRLGLLTRALAVQAWSRARLGDLITAAPIAAEAVKLAQETGQPFMGGLAKAVQAEIAALRGEHEQAGKLADEAERAGLAAGARPVLATVQLARGILALSEGRFEDAFAQLSRVLDPADPAHQPALRAYFLPELTDAAVRSGQTDAMRDILRTLAPFAGTSPALDIGLRYAHAVLESTEDAFTTALRAELVDWPAERGRLHLAFGEWLRRQRRVVESRAHLRTARETFDALGMAAWSERARRELRSAGESSPNRDPDARERLTPHELSIAQLAATGLTNREIGQQLYLSHRTVGTHLQRIFPKLGVNSRTELAQALGQR
ncbi:AAA family ATPase [Amycolatopsis sp. YIM 10]|uniref:ATP-binding protein n=1 Tax=Amycolatopsis sp. YIM 10 TaxID=2653857 RepID=UPI00129031B0|nr:AAA family ATPase [Amycolatopsis sp. YIM 10]QFU88506.1 Transcriptional regulatory protein LiaR [Amycolatopsis sp. YIM 10]